MKKSVSAAEANREFSAVLRSVRRGHSFVVTSHGRPVARIVPVTSGDEIGNAGRASLFKRLRSAPVLALAPWTRDELYRGRVNVAVDTNVLAYAEGLHDRRARVRPAD